MESTLQKQQNRCFEIEGDLTGQIATKEQTINELQSELSGCKASLESLREHTKRLETWKKSHALQLTDSVVEKQLHELRKEHESALIAYQVTIADNRSKGDR